jgi:hypothetical protein
MIAENASSPGGGTAHSAPRTRAARPGVARLLNSERARFGSWLPWLHAQDCIRRTTASFAAARRWLAAGCGRPVLKLTGCLVRALPVVVPASAVCPACRSLNLALPDESAAAAICRSRRCFHRAGSVSSWPPPPVGRRVLGMDAVGGAPHCNFANEGGARVASGCSPGWRGVTLADLILDLVGEVGD